MLGCRCQLQEKEINPPDVTPAVCVVLSPGFLGAAAVTCGGGSSRPTSGPLPKHGDRDPAGWRPHRGGSQRCPGAAGPAEPQRERQSRLRPGPGAHSTAPPALFCPSGVGSRGSANAVRLGERSTQAPRNPAGGRAAGRQLAGAACVSRVFRGRPWLPVALDDIFRDVCVAWGTVGSASRLTLQTGAPLPGAMEAGAQAGDRSAQ